MMTAISLPRRLALPKIFLSLWLPVGLLLVGYVLATHFSEQQQLHNEQRIRQAVTQRLEKIAEDVKTNVTLYQYGLRGTRGAIMTAGPDNFNYPLMQAYTLSRDYQKEFPGARGFGLIRYLQSDQQVAFLAQRAKERPDYPFNIKQLQKHNESVFVITYIEPEQNNKEAVGLDIGSESMRRRAALEAALNNDVRLTGPITLVQASEKIQHGFLILMPVYYSQPAPEQQQRLSQLYGWSYAPILIDEVLSTVSELRDDVQFSISDITENDEVFFNWGSSTLDPAYQQSTTLSLFGRQWQLSLLPADAFISELQLASNNRVFSETLGLTGLICLGVFLLQLLVMRRQQLARYKAELASITEATLKQANAELEHQVALRTAEISQVNILQRSILTSAGYAIIASTPDGTITAFNPAAERLTGYLASEVIQQHTPTIFHCKSEVEQRAQKLSDELQHPITPGFEVFTAKAKHGQADSCRWTYIRKDGSTVQVKLNVSAMLDSQGQISGYLGIAFDLTEQLKHEAELALAKEQAELASKAKSDFLANMSHEIRTPMNAILGLLQLVSQTSLAPRQADYINKTQHAAKSLLALLNDILDFSKVEAGKLELDLHSFNLPSLMQDINVMLANSASEKNLALHYHLSPDIPPNLIGDSLRLKQVLLNLAGNAIKFTEHGEVNIYVAASQMPDARLRLQFRVQDTGIGMTIEQQQAIFSGFHQAESSISRRFGGTGLGLAISKRLVNLMQGSISVSSQPGIGSEFSFDILLDTDHGTVEQRQTQATEDSTTLLQPNTLQGLHLLVVEDNLTNQLVAQQLLQSQGASVDVASSGADALERLVPLAQDYDMVLMDIQMPQMDGYETTRRIRQHAHLQQLPIIAMTANALPSDKASCLAAGMNDHIAKPFELAVLLDKILTYCPNTPATATTTPAPSTQTLDDSHAFCRSHQISFSQALLRLGGATELYAKVLQQFLNDMQTALQTLEETTLNPKALRILLHSLKGASATVGFEQLSAWLAIQEAALNNDAVQLTSLRHATATKLTENLPIVTELLHLLDLALQPEQAATTLLTDSEKNALYLQLAQYLTSANMAAQPLFKQLESDLIAIDPLLAKSMRNAMLALAFDAAAEILQQILSVKTM